MPHYLFSTHVIFCMPLKIIAKLDSTLFQISVFWFCLVILVDVLAFWDKCIEYAIIRNVVNLADLFIKTYRLSQLLNEEHFTPIKVPLYLKRFSSVFPSIPQDLSIPAGSKINVMLCSY